MSDLESITIVNPGSDEWIRNEGGSRFRIIRTPDRRWRRGILFVRAEDYLGQQLSIRDRLIEVTANLSAFIGGLALSKPVCHSVLRLIELAG